MPSADAAAECGGAREQRGGGGRGEAEGGGSGPAAQKSTAGKVGEGDRSSRCTGDLGTQGQARRPTRRIPTVARSARGGLQLRATRGDAASLRLVEGLDTGGGSTGVVLGQTERCQPDRARRHEATAMADLPAALHRPFKSQTVVRRMVRA
nr:uncharacterized protein LOC127305977 [Lolium perenne]